MVGQVQVNVLGVLLYIQMVIKTFKLKDWFIELNRYNFV